MLIRRCLLNGFDVPLPEGSQLNRLMCLLEEKQCVFEFGSAEFLICS